MGTPTLANDLRRLVYRSESCISHDDVPALDAIFRVSIRNNKREGITGCLALPDGRFVQVIEGSDGRVNWLMERISADSRHQNIAVLGDWPIRARLFSGWAMARPDPTPLSDQAFRIATQHGSGAQVTGILLTLMDDVDQHHLL
jgi:hypothetical protein